jgi:hypothetical protein
LVQDPFPDPEHDGEEPDRSAPPAAAGTGPEASHAGEGPVQGLFVCLPAEDLDVARFAQHGESDSMPPGPLLAEVVHALTGQDGGGLAALSDDQLMGIIAATRRLESRIAWTQLAAIGEFATRRGSQQRDRTEFAADELACGLHLTWQSAAAQIDYATAVASRLPRTFAALAAGTIHPVHVRIVEDETSILSDQYAAEADEELAAKAGSLTYGQLRSLAHRLVLKLDPEAARKRREAARREAQVRRFREGSGNAGMVARELPPDEVLASWQHVEQRALDLRAAGLPGTLRELRVRAYLDLLQERGSRTVPAASEDGPADPGQAGEPDGLQNGDGGQGPGGPGGSGSGPRNAPAGTGPDGPARPAAPDPGPSVAALVTITVPWSTGAGQSEVPGEAGGFGLLDADNARDLVAAAAVQFSRRYLRDLTGRRPPCLARHKGWAPSGATRTAPREREGARSGTPGARLRRAGSGTRR